MKYPNSLKILSTTAASMLGLLCAVLLAVGSTHAETASAKTDPEKPRKIFAHYMGCFPAGSGPTYLHQFNDAEYRKNFRHDGTSKLNLKGGRFKTWPLVPNLTKPLTSQESADLEIRRALRAGIDGFAIDTWAGGNVAKDTLSALIKAAEAGNYPFEVTICLDPWSMEGGTRQAAYEEAVIWLLKNHGKSPKLGRRDGKPLILTYQGQGIVAGAKVPSLATKEGQEALINAYKVVEEKAGEPLYFYFDFSELLQGQTAKGKSSKDVLLEAAPVLSGYFGAVGNFLDLNGLTRNKGFMQKMSEEVRKAGAEWAPPVWYQYDNVSWHLENVDGTDKLRETWQRAMDQDATFIQFATWNDYGEHTSLAPTLATNYGIGILNHYYAQWWKTGQPPEIKEDQIFLTYRSSPKGSESYPFQGPNMGSSLEVLTLLTAPGKIKVGDKEEAVEAGLSVRKFELPVGEIQADLLRDGEVVQTVKGRQTVSQLPMLPNATLYCSSTGDERYWQEDFPGVPFPEDDLYGDKDEDGLPNWFEMYWFGKWRNFSTATAADAGADPDQDGKTNLQEYQAKTDPTKKAAEYKSGQVWDMKAVLERGVSMNPTQDSLGSPVWRYVAKEVKGEEPLLHDGKYGPMYYPHPSGVGFFTDGRSLGLVAWIKEGPNTLLHFSGQQKKLLVGLAWTSPVDGKVDVDFTIKTVNGSPPEKAIFSVEDPENKELWKQSLQIKEGNIPVSLKDIAVKAGQTIHFLHEGRMQVKLESLKITLK